MDGEVAYAGGGGKATRGSMTTASEQRAERFHHPLVLIEAPPSEARSLAVIAKARDLAPGTPLAHVVRVACAAHVRHARVRAGATTEP
jgi:hypothetical protein